MRIRPTVVLWCIAVITLCAIGYYFDRPIQAAASYNPKSGDPCSINMRVVTPISLTASAQLIAGTSGKQTYICGFNADASGGTQSIALVEGTGTTCATSIAGMAGGTTAATGWNLANQQMIMISTSNAWTLATATAADNVCLLLSGSTQVSGFIQYVQQ